MKTTQNILNLSVSVLKVFVCTALISLPISSCSNRATSFALPSEQGGFSGQVFYNNKVDILFVVDNSKSMLQYQQRLSARMNDMVSTLNNLKMDYRVAVTTSTMAKDTVAYPISRKIVGTPAYLTAANINLLTERIIVGESGSDLERSLDAMTLVTSPSYLSSIGSDFMRADALFAVVFITDELDQSSEFGNPNSQDFINLLNARKPVFDTGARGWIANYIGILTNQSCDNLGGFVAIGTQFIALVDESHGAKSSICNADLSTAVSNIKARIIDQITAYRFKDIPNKSSIHVTIAGRATFEDAINGWTLESEVISGKTIYSLKFHGSSVPAANEFVDVKYTPMGAT
jgi:hypothetical protein